ncbi:MAG: response regulator [Nitrospirota bacterium]|nr:response regulator [Nitrospirota bacterium]
MKTKAKILIVENDGIIAKDLESVLGRLGYVVPAAVFSGEEALQKAEELKPDLIITEVVLDGKMDGIEVAYRINSRFNIPVVFLTASTDKRTVERVRKVNPYGFITKPFGEDLLHTTIETAIYRHSMENVIKEDRNDGVGAKSEVSAYKTSEAGLQEGWTRATFIVKKGQLEKIKALAYWDRKKVKDVVSEALEAYLKDKEVLPVLKED